MPSTERSPDLLAAARKRAGGQLLAGATALVAGGTGNVGRHLVGALLGAGATVIVPSRSPEKLNQLRSTLGADCSERLVTLVGDIADEQTADRLRMEAVARTGRLDGVVASLGSFVAAPSLLTAPRSDLVRALEGYLLTHFVVARTLIPALQEGGGSYTFINGALAFPSFPSFPGTGLLSIATAGQAMLAQVLMKELEETRVRVNELVLYSSFGWGDADQRNLITGEDIGRCAAYLISDQGAAVRGQTIHLKPPEPVASC